MIIKFANITTLNFCMSINILCGEKEVVIIQKISIAFNVGKTVLEDVIELFNFEHCNLKNLNIVVVIMLKSLVNFNSEKLAIYNFPIHHI